MLCVASLFVLGYFGILENEFLSNFLIQCVVMFSIPILLYSLLVSKNAKQTFKDFGFKKISFSILICSILLGFVLYIVNSYVAQFFHAVISILGYDNSINIHLSIGGDVSKEFLLTAILPGICEEVAHRGLLLNGSHKQGYTRFGLIFSSLLFGLLHLNIQQFFYATILGVFMGITVLVSDSIFPSMIIHFMNNALSVYFSLGYTYNLPFTKWRIKFLNELYSLPLFQCVVVIAVILAIMIGLYFLIISRIIKIKKKEKYMLVAKDLKLEDKSYAELQEKLSDAKQEIYVIKSQPLVPLKDNGKALTPLDKIFTYNAVILGALITICSFIWGIL